MSLFSLEAFALSTNTFAMAGAEFMNVLTIGSDAGLVGGSAFTSSVARDVPFSKAFTFATITDAVIRTRAEFAIIAIARKVVTFAIIARHNL